MKRKKIFLYGSIILLVAIAAYWFLKKDNAAQVVTYETATVKIGSISNSVTATGTVEPVKQVEVGTQVSGVIQKIYVDYNSRVKKGQLLAELDKSPLMVQLESAKADLESAESAYTYQQSNFDRIKQLHDKKAVSDVDYETALYQYSTAKANYTRMKSEVEKAKTNLGYAMIYSPIDGVVLNRAVDEGQTVAASFNTPTLFTIAQDLTKMQVVANVDEADIGQVNEGQKVVFTVDAYPDDSFTGTIKQVRLQAVTNSNVVTYSVVIDAPNPQLKLKPGLTASITAYTREVKDALVIPSKALRFVPDNQALNSLNTGVDTTGKKSPALLNSATASTSLPGNIKEIQAQKQETATDTEVLKTVWVKSGNQIHPVTVTTGLTDEINTEIKSGLKEGEEVVISMTQVKASATTNDSNKTESPFMPKRPGKK